MLLVIRDFLTWGSLFAVLRGLQYFDSYLMIMSSIFRSFSIIPASSMNLTVFCMDAMSESRIVMSKS